MLEGSLKAAKEALRKQVDTMARLNAENSRLTDQTFALRVSPQHVDAVFTDTTRLLS